MKIKLLKDFIRGGKVKVASRRDRAPVAFFAGVTMEVSDATAAKWIEAGIAETLENQDATEIAVGS